VVKNLLGTLHYNTITGMQNLISIASGGERIEDMCMCCNYVVVKKDDKEGEK